MADTHPYNQYEILIRRIGYSVGLEDLVARVKSLTELYVEERDINTASWKRLVKEVYNRKISDDFEVAKWGGSKKANKKIGAEDHFADFYSELNLIYRQHNQIFPLYGIEVLSILRRFINEDEKYELTLKRLLLLFIIEADGDIFLNCLLGNFEKNLTKENLFRMFQKKREIYSKAYISPFSQKKISSIFKVQSTTTQSSAFIRKPLKAEDEIPEDYITKVLPTRKGWATDLDLYSSSNKIKEFGERLLVFLTHKYIVNDNLATFYCYSETHKLLLIDEKHIDIHPIHHKSFLYDFFHFAFNVDNKKNNSSLNRIQVYEILKKIMDYYKQGNRSKSIIRHQLPLQILYPTFYAISAVFNFEYIDLESFLNEEKKSPNRMLDVLHLRGNEMEGALTFK